MSSDAIEIDVEALVDDIEVDVSSVYGQEGITPTGSTEIIANGTYDVTNYASAIVDVPSSGITPTGTKSISANGTYDVTNFASASVSVPNSYSQSDEGKVVSSGALVSQSSQTVTENGTYDTTLKNSVTVNVPTGGGGLTTIASGSFVGAGSYDLPVAIGNKMAKTDFWFKFNARANSEFPYDTNYKYGYGMVIISSDFGHFDLSTVGDSKTIISDKSVKINNSGTISTVDAGTYIGDIEHVRNAAANSISRPNNFRINRKSTGFELRYYNSNASHQYATGITYDYEVVYFGSNPSTDIVEVS